MTEDISSRDLLVRVDQTVVGMQNELLGANGRIPRMEQSLQDHNDSDNANFAAINKQLQNHNESDNANFAAINKQLNFWRGGLALTAFMFVVFGAVFVQHLLSGK